MNSLITSSRAATPAAVAPCTSSPGSDVVLRLHGYPQVVLGGRSAPLKLKRGLALLAYLSEQRGRVGRDALAALLWPDARPGLGRGRLRRALHETHAVLGRALIDGDADALWLAPGVTSDLHATRAAAEALDLATLAASHAVQVLAGFTLGSDAFDDWAEQRRREQAALIGRALERGLAQALAQAPEHEPASLALAEQGARALLRLEPCAEVAHATLIEAAARRGDEAALEAAYFEAARVWREELGLKPSARLEAAYAHAGALLREASQPVDIAFAPTSQGQVAHAVWGQGQGKDLPTIVALWGLMTNLEVGLDEPRVRAMLERLSRRHRVVMVDRRGMGLSERIGIAPTAASAQEDVLAVLDHLGERRAWLFGSSVGGTMALDIALRRPDRVAGLLLFGTSSSGRWSPETPWAPHARALEDWLARLSDPAHYDEGLRRFAPSVADDARVRAWYARLLRNAASRAGVAELLRGFHALDLRARLPRVAVPTLVMQRTGDRVVPLAAGEQLAAAIPGARLERLAGDDHFLWHGDAGAVVRAIEGFVAGARGPAAVVKAA
jgi:pimeloyl-ACP methyl ester carboxylesterase/DNA-binding SARP family transcriptional activator